MHAWLMQGMHAMSGVAVGGVAHVAELGNEIIPRLHESHISGKDLMARSPGELVAVAASCCCQLLQLLRSGDRN